MKPYIFRTKDYGQSWQAMVDENKVKGYALCMIQDPVEPNLIFVGTEHGLWISFDNGTSYQPFKNNYPPVSTFDLAIQEREADLCIASFGRAIYILDDIRPLRKMASLKGQPFSKKITAFDPPTAYQASYKTPPGYEWSTWGLYEGENRRRGAEYSFYLKKDTSAKSRSDSATVKIYNDANELIRTTKVKADSGLNRNYWNFETKGTRQPGTPKPKPDAPEPLSFGLPAPPGNYKLVISFNKESDSLTLVVKEDPGVPFNATQYTAKKAMISRLEKSVVKTTEVTDRLTEAEETIAKIDAQYKNVEGKDADSVRKTGKAMTDSIKTIRDFIFGKKTEKQGSGSPYQVTVTGQLQEARGEIIGKQKVPDEQEERMVKIAESMVSEAVLKTNAFISGKWKEYQRLTENMPVKIFKEYKEIQ
jgi:flagellar hook assembly protein FlgD